MATRNIHRVDFGQAFKRAREAAQLEPEQVEAALGWGPGKVWRVERGDRNVAPAEVDKFASMCSVDRALREHLHLLADQARKKESPTRVADFARSYVALARDATEITYYDAELVPGLFQAQKYATEVLAHSRTTNVEGAVADRLSRQSIVTKDPAPQVRVVLGEAALWRQVGGRTGLLEQMEQLLRWGQLSNVSLRVLPFTAGAHCALGVGFTVLRLTTPEITRVYLEGNTGATYIAERREVAIYARDFKSLQASALDEDASANFIRGRIDLLERTEGENA